jgi:hypothetical protein
MSPYPLNSYDLYPPGASRDPTFGVSGWVSSGGFGNLIGGGALPGGVRTDSSTDCPGS